MMRDLAGKMNSSTEYGIFLRKVSPLSTYLPRHRKQQSFNRREQQRLTTAVHS